MDAQRFADSGEVYEWLLEFVNVEKGQATVFKLDRMRELAAALGSPERAYGSIHVAGSKGKGSVSTMTASILSAAGHRVGLYTSPHLLDWKERIAVVGADIGEASLLRAAEAVHELVRGRSASHFPGGELPTFFELVTLIAFETFRLEGCDMAVIETGLGGRLDSTNIVEPLASVITPLELEHTEWLGDSIEKIAFEKAGIIKEGKPVCISAQVPPARAVLEGAATARGSPLIEVEREVSFDSVEVARSGTRVRLDFKKAWPWRGTHEFRSPMIGEVQARNLGQALLSAALALPDLDLKAAREGLERARLPARFELISEQPPVIVDGAHTPTSVSLALASLEALYPEPKILLFGCAADKRHGEMAALLAGRFESIVITTPGSFKKSAPEAVYGSFSALDPRTRLVKDPREAFAQCIEEAGKKGMVLFVTGSFYLYAEAMASLGRRE